MESQFWSYISDGLKSVSKNIDLHRIENGVEVGTPDVNYCIDGVEGWIELKEFGQCPASGIVRIPLFTQEQKIWLYERCKAGGNAFFFLKIKDLSNYLLFKGDGTIFSVGTKFTEHELYTWSITHWSKRINFKALKGVLTNGKR